MFGTNTHISNFVELQFHTQNATFLKIRAQLIVLCLKLNNCLMNLHKVQSQQNVSRQGDLQK